MSRTEYIVTGEAMIVGGQIKGELIRCKDCKHRNNSLRCPIALLAETVMKTKVFDFKVSDDWFCADGEKAET